MLKMPTTSLFLLLLLTQGAHAALFDDKEARKKILEVEQQMNTQNQALKDRISKLEATLKTQEQGMVDLLGQIDQQNRELNRLKGELEVAQHNLELAQQRQKDLYADTDARLRKLEGTAEAPAASGASTAPVAAIEPSANANEAADFEAAQALSKAGKHKEAFDAYEKFLQTYPNSARTSEVQYVLGFTQFSLKNYKAAMATQEKMLAQFPDAAKAPDALFNIANCQIQLSDIDSAKKTLRNLLTKYPDSAVAPSAKKRLSILEAIKTK
jgi:tol-pal system protein YbgF